MISFFLFVFFCCHLRITTDAVRSAKVAFIFKMVDRSSDQNVNKQDMNLFLFVRRFLSHVIRLYKGVRILRLLTRR